MSAFFFSAVKRSGRKPFPKKCVKINIFVFQITRPFQPNFYQIDLMQKRVFLLFIFLFVFQTIEAQPEIDELLVKLDQTISRSPGFIQQKENTLEALKKHGSHPGLSPEAIFRFNARLLEAYRQYRFDSALHYVNQNVLLSEKVGKLEWIYGSLLQLSEVLISAGLYKEALENLGKIQVNKLNDSLRTEYYHDQKLVYESLKEYAQDSKFAPLYAEKARAYQDSLLQLLNPASDQYAMEMAIRQMNEGKLDAAETILLDFYKRRLVPGTAQFASSTAILSYLYRLKGKSFEERKFRILSAISDIEAVVKENTSLTELAVRLYEEGEIEHANEYIAYAMADANFFNARQRKIEIAKIYPIITKAYQLEKKKQEDRLRLYISLITGVTLLLGLAILALYFQKVKLSKARINLSLLNEDLQKANSDLNDLNNRLKEANFIKEDYIGHFLNQCSAYIDKLESYQKKVHRLLASKQFNELQKLADSQDLIKMELVEFYNNFDQAFLKLFPDFVSEFNALLDPNQSVVPRKGELLTTELRIFALIRLGINDSYKIAHFLRYSPNTIYNYRAQIKNKALVDRELFEKWVLKIGTEMKK